MSRIDVLDAITVIVLETQKKALKQDVQYRDCKRANYIDRLERQRQKDINSPEGRLIREILEASRDIPKLETQQ